MGEVEAQPPFRAFISYAFKFLCHSLSQSQCRPWAEFFGQTALPLTFWDATDLIHKNFSYFRFNYCVIVSLTLAVSLLRHPFTFLILLGLLAAWIFTDSETLVRLSALSLCIVFLIGVGSVLLSSVMIGVAVVCVHGALRIPEDRFTEPQQHNSSQPNNNDMSPSCSEQPPQLILMDNGEYKWI